MLIWNQCVMSCSWLSMIQTFNQCESDLYLDSMWCSLWFWLNTIKILIWNQCVMSCSWLSMIQLFNQCESTLYLDSMWCNLWFWLNTIKMLIWNQCVLHLHSKSSNPCHLIINATIKLNTILILNQCDATLDLQAMWFKAWFNHYNQCDHKFINYNWMWFNSWVHTCISPTLRKAHYTISVRFRV